MDGVTKYDHQYGLEVGKYFRNGTRAPMKTASLFVVDLRQLELTSQQAQDIHDKINDLIIRELEGAGIDLSARSCHDLSKSVLGFAIE